MPLSQTDPPPATDPSLPQIRLRHASFGYTDKIIVDGASLDLHAGEVIALLGPNASGKSTLVKGILGLVPLLRGAVEVFGVPLGVLRDRTRVGYVPQRNTLSTSVRSTVREIVATGRLAHRPWWRPANARDRDLVLKAIDTVGLADRIDDDVSTLSGGQQRRVLIARALSGEPEVLIMDEPTAGVDQASQVALSQVLAELARAGTSMLIVTHELGALSPILTRVVCLDSGRVDFDGSLREWAAVSQAHGESHGAGHQFEPPTDARMLLGPDPLASTVGED